MAQPVNDVITIATAALGADGFSNKVAPIAPVTTLGYGEQSLTYQQLNYLMHNHAEWLEYINEEQIPNHVNSTTNPHSVTKTQVGLSNVENYVTSDSYTLDSSTTYASSKAVNDGVTSAKSDVTTHAALTTNPHSVTKTQVGLSNVANYTTSNSYTLDSSTTYASSKAVNDGLDASKADWVVKSGTLVNGAAVPIPVGFTLSDCHISVTQSQSYNGNWDIDEGANENHYQSVCRVVAGVVDSYTRVYNQTPLGYEIHAVNVAYVLIGRKGSF